MNAVPLQQIPSGRTSKTIGQLGELKEDPAMVNNKKILTLILIGIVGVLATGCSDDSVSPTAVDTAPPAVPANVRSTFDFAAGVAVISWNENTVDSDLAGYVVSRENQGQTDYLVSSPLMITTIQDSNPLRGVTLYSVYAVDLAGNQSAVASVTVTNPFVHQLGDLSH